MSSTQLFQMNQFIDTHFPEPARGWVQDIYYPRKQELSDTVSHVSFQGEYAIIQSRVWKEVEETGFGIFLYEETASYHQLLKNGLYDITIHLYNPNEVDYHAFIRCNGIVKNDGVLVKSGTTVKVDFQTFVHQEVLFMQFLPGLTTELSEIPIEGKVYIESISIESVKRKEPHDKITLYLASDSTVQSYDAHYFPQTGWGQMLYRFFDHMNNVHEYACSGCNYPQAKVYEMPSIIIENRAIGGRSSRSFIEEGKLDDLLKDMRPKDFLFVQFGHNDASKNRPNRYVNVTDYTSYIQTYIDACKILGVTCVLVTPVARRNCDEHGSFQISFLEYREAMLNIAQNNHIPLLDLGRYSTEYLQTLSFEQSKSLYMWLSKDEYPNGAYAEGLSDNTHLNQNGATIFAGIVTNLINSYDIDSQLDPIKSCLISRS